jgi:hypothetical protein
MCGRQLDNGFEPIRAKFMDRRTKSHAKTQSRKEGESDSREKGTKCANKRQDESTLTLGYGTGLAAKERKDRKKERDTKPLNWAEIRCELWADNNRYYLEFDP